MGTASEVVIPKNVTKKKMRTRAVPMNPKLGVEIARWKKAWTTALGREATPSDFVFPGRDHSKHITRQNIDHALRKASRCGQGLNLQTLLEMSCDPVCVPLPRRCWLKPAKQEPLEERLHQMNHELV